jgi:ribosome-associated heat shock protein Hsp15
MPEKEKLRIDKYLWAKVLKVTGVLENRADAKTVVNFFEDITPVEQTHAFKSMFHAPLLKRDRGTGRPTKKDRREIDDLKDDFFEKPGN